MVKKLKWNLVLMSALYLGLGVFLLMKPTTALNIVCYALGTVVLACAAVQLIRYFVVERGVFQSQLTLISGIICLALGAFLILRSDIVVSILPIVFGLFVIFDSISRVQNALDLRRCGYSSWKSFLLLPVLSVVLGVIMILNPFGTMETLVMAIGIILIVEGSINLISALYTVLAVRRFAKLHPETQSMLESLTGEDLNGDGVVAPDVTRTDAEASAVELDEVDESATVEQENEKIKETSSSLLSQTAPSGMGPLARPETFPFPRKFAGMPKAPSMRELANPKGLTEGVRNQNSKGKREMEKYDLIIVGAGPAGIFTAVELLRHGSKKKMLLVEKGKPVEKRHCPKAEVGHCVNCRPTCAITTGFSGAGAFSDGKLSLSYEVGGDLPTLIGEEFAQELIDYTDKIYLEFGADPHVEGIYTGEEIKEIRKNAIHAGLKLVDCPIRHLGTEKAQQLYLAIQNYLADNGVEMLFNTECENIILENEECKGVLLKDGDQVRPVYADTVVIGTGRRGADWLEKICAEHHIAHKPGTVDIGVRVECRNEVMEKVNKVLYESKLIGYPKPWKNKVRTFCQNPGGFVAQENYDNDLAVVNGHSFKEKKSENTNLAILVSHNFTEPFNQPIAYAQKVGELTNMLGAGHIMVQRYGDILDGKRTWQKELAQSNVKPTLKDAVAGDITAAMPYRAMTNIIEFIKMLDMVVPGFAANETLLYSPELKFYSNKVKMDENLDTNIKGLHCLGDSSGWTRGLMMASVMGVLMGRKLAEKEGC